MIVVRAVVALVVVGLVFWLVERVARRGPRGPRPQRALDVAYWMLTAVVVKPATKLAVAPAVIAVALITGLRADTGLLDGFGPIAALPWAAQAALAVVLLDFTGYWLHRAFHRGWLWRIHAVHHSSASLDWLSSVRVHPLGTLMRRAAQAVPFLLLGFPPLTLVAVTPFLTAFALLLHADVPWTWGPLGRVLASPAFHRWHHAADGPARGCNFAGLFSVWDALFGTWYLPEVRPETLGVRGEPVPAGLVGQLLHPVRRAG